MSDQTEEERTHTLEVDGARLALTEVGPADAHPLVALHGGPGESHHGLRPHLDALASGARRVVYYDQRGGGDSRLDEGTKAAGYQEHVADLERVREHLGAERMDVLGFSWGALLAVLYAVEHPTRVSKLVLVSPPARIAGAQQKVDTWAPGERLESARQRPEVQALVEELEREAEEGDEAAGRRARFAARVAPVLFDPSMARRLTPVTVNAAAEQAATRSLEDLDLGPRLERLGAIPTLVVTGAQDPVAAPSVPAAAARFGARHLALEECGHAPFAEVPDAFVRAVLEHLTS